MLKILIRLYPVVPVVLILVTVFLVINTVKKMNTYSECLGTIVGFSDNTTQIRNDIDNSISRSPIVTYTINGREYEFIGGYYSTSMKIGDSVKLLYNKEDPEKVSIKSGLIFAPVITGILGLAFILPIPIFLVLQAKGIISL